MKRYMVESYGRWRRFLGARFLGAPKELEEDDLRAAARECAFPFAESVLIRLDGREVARYEVDGRGHFQDVR